MIGKCGHNYDYEKSILDQSCHVCGNSDCENNPDFYWPDEMEEDYEDYEEDY